MVELSFSIEIIVYDDKHAFYKVNLSALTAEASLTNIYMKLTLLRQLLSYKNKTQPSCIPKWIVAHLL